MLGNLDSRRDWGYAPDFVEAMWRMLQQEQAGDYVLATGETHSVREFVEAASRVAGMDIAWEGSGPDEVGIDRRTGRAVVAIDPKHYRPSEVDLLLGNPEKARRVLGWKPSVGFGKLVEIMMRADMELLNVRPTNERLTIFSGIVEDQEEREGRVAVPNRVNGRRCAADPVPTGAARRKKAV